MELLQPIASDSARALAISANAALHAELRQMAEDSTAWGAMAARAALNRYAGTNYREIVLDDAVGSEESARMSSSVPDASALAAFLLLSPNPSNGEVRVGYGLPQDAQQVSVRVFDEWGRPAGEHLLDARALSEGVRLHLRGGLYHCQLVADGKVVATERLLISY